MISPWENLYHEKLLLELQINDLSNKQKRATNELATSMQEELKDLKNRLHLIVQKIQDLKNENTFEMSMRLVNKELNYLFQFEKYVTITCDGNLIQKKIIKSDSDIEKEIEGKILMIHEKFMDDPLKIEILKYHLLYLMDYFKIACNKKREIENTTASVSKKSDTNNSVNFTIVSKEKIESDFKHQLQPLLILNIILNIFPIIITTLVSNVVGGILILTGQYMYILLPVIFGLVLFILCSFYFSFIQTRISLAFEELVKQNEFVIFSEIEKLKENLMNTWFSNGLLCFPLIIGIIFFPNLYGKKEVTKGIDNLTKYYYKNYNER